MANIWERMLLVRQLARLGAQAPKDSNTAWESYWSRISSTGRRGQVLWDADSTAEKERYAAFIRRHLDTALPVIDVGCGNGTFTRWLAGTFSQALGVDVSGSAIRRAEAESTAGTAQYAVLDAVADGSGDRLLQLMGPSNIFLRGVLHVLSPADRVRLVRNLHQAAGGQGRVLLAETNFTGGSLKYVEYLGASSQRIPDPLKRAVEGLPKPSRFGPPERRAAFPASAWEVVADGPTTIEAVPMHAGDATERIPGYVAVLAPR
jgi:SAM-dependent methyltransferase